jgi:ubiquinone/menaquinone biosynthesis C-methylase UbiE
MWDRQPFAAAEIFPRARFIGMDPVPDYLAYARATVDDGRADFVVGVVEQIPFADGAFDCCLSLLLLQDIRDRAAALSEMHRVTGQGGIVAACQWDCGQGMPMLIAIREVLKLLLLRYTKAWVGLRPARLRVRPSFASTGRLRVLRTSRPYVWSPRTPT